LKITLSLLFFIFPFTIRKRIIGVDLRNTAKILIFFLLAVALAGCAGSQFARAEFDQSLDKYNELIRLQDFDTATAFLSSSVASEYKGFSGKNIRVTDYQVTDVKYDEKTGQASAKVVFEYYITTSGIVKKITDEEKWIYTGEKGKKAWKLASPPPTFR
jgi:hypothetical protein